MLHRGLDSIDTFVSLTSLHTTCSGVESVRGLEGVHQAGEIGSVLISGDQYVGFPISPSG
jgi:hypothetical protein